jgi:hypothetical protein
MEPNKRQKIKIPFDYDKELFNLCIAILNYHKNKELIEESSDYKYYRYINLGIKHWDINENDKRFHDFTYLCHKRYIYIKTRLSKKDVGVILMIFKILYSNTNDFDDSSNDIIKNEPDYDEYLKMCEMDGLETNITEDEFEDFETDINMDYIDNYRNIKYIHLHIEWIKMINIFVSDIICVDDFEEIYDGCIEIDEKYKSNFIEYKQKGYLIEEIIDLFEYVDK